jgi:thioredoxin-dependent peroxiredoxin
MNMRPKPGDPAPDFAGLTTDGSRVRLRDYRGKTLVLYFYPRDDTPGCTAQACSLRDRNAEIMAKGAAVLGVSAQDVESHQRFSRKYKLSFPLLADTDRAVARAYGAIGGGLGGTLRGMLGMAERVTFVIDAQGRIAHVIDDVDTKDHATQVLALL